MAVKFAIAHPIFNSRFNIMKRLTHTLALDLAATGKFPRLAIPLPLGGPINFNNILGNQNTTPPAKTEPFQGGRLNKMIFGPSTAAGGSTDAVEVQHPTLGGFSLPIIGTVTQSVGSGLDDLTIGGTYIAASSDTWTLKMINGSTTGPIAQFTDPGGGLLTNVLDVAHGLSLGDFIDITVTSNYNGTYELVGSLGPDAFQITHAFVADETGTWTEREFFQYKKGAEAFSSSIMIDGTAQALKEGLTATWGAISGHTTNDEWTVPITAGFWIEVTLENGVKYSYLAGDPITLICLGFPEGWVTGISSVPNNTDSKWGNIIEKESHNDLYALRLYDYDTATANPVVSIAIGELIGGHYYRLEITYRYSAIATGRMGVYLVDSAGLAMGSIALTVASVWSTVSVLIQADDDVILGSGIIIKKFDATISADKLEIKSISVSHAGSATLSETWVVDYKTNGRLTLDTDPTLGIRVSRITDSGGRLVATAGKRVNNVLVKEQILPVTRYTVSYRFDHATEDDVRKIQHLMDWQNRGNLINHWPELDGLPSVITGRFRIRNKYRKTITDLTDNSFQLVFEEVAT